MQYAAGDRTLTRTSGAGSAAARIVSLMTTIVVGIIVIGIVLVLLGAGNDVDIVRWIEDAAAWLATPFSGLFSLESNRWEKALDWGVAAIVYSIVGSLVARMLAR